MKNKILNSIRTGALCDALGFPLEFNRNPKDLELGFPLEFTDDTQMTLFIMEGLRSDCVDEAMIDWYHTQIRVNTGYKGSTWLYQDKRLHKQMAPGTTCLNSLHYHNLGIERPYNDSKGNGALIRSAPFGMISWSPFMCYKKAASHSNFTHDHILSEISSGAFAMMISYVLNTTCSIRDAALQTITWLRTYNNLDYEYAADLLETAIYLANNNLKPYDYLGEGWVAEECLALAVYSAILYERNRDFKTALKYAICHKGDSDSVGSVFGNLVGLIINDPEEPFKSLGISINNLKCSDIIEQVVNDFCEKLGKE